MVLRHLVVALVATIILLAAAPGLAHEDHEKPPARPAAAAEAAAPPMASMDHGLMEVQEPPKPMPQRLYSWLGRLHPAVVHFPIALFLVTAMLEAAALLGRRPRLADGARVLVALAALSALAAAALGWLAMGFPSPAEDLTHTLHRWIGTSIAMLGLLAWWAKERSMRRGVGARRLYGLILGLVFMAVLSNAYLGGALTHGANHLRF